MKPVYPLISLWLLLLIACSGEKKSQAFSLTAEFDVPDRSYLYFWQEEYKTGISLDSVLVQKGKAVYQGSCEDLARIEITTEAGERLLSLYVKNGDRIKMKGHIAAPYEITFSGTPEQELIGKFRNDNHTLLSRVDEGDRRFFSHLGDTLYRDSLTALRDTLHQRVIDFALVHPDSYASTLLIYDYLLAPETVETVDTLLRDLAPEAKPVSLLAKTELYLTTMRKNPTGKVMPHMTFRTSTDSSITTSGFRRNTTLLTVWATYDSLSRRQMQVLKFLRQKYSPSFLRIVSVALDNDEEQWREVLRNDSLEGWPQCLLREGWNANQVDNLGVQTLPATFVLNGSGRIVAKNLYDEALVEAVDNSVALVGEDTVKTVPSTPSKNRPKK
ncbi:MAG: DUF4369 domain-containing protein [Porphyromonadaceae bacterium]|nr:DUF4369 domain-containing protein [Porphyromonadaceae bacterium]